jgi:N-acetylmuramoyl-L-alanine amidase
MSKQTDFISKIAPVIKRYAQQYGFTCCSGIIAQACLESAWGTSDKAARHNYFGLKYRNGRVSCHSGYFKAGSKEEYTKGQLTNIVGSWYKFDSMEKGVEGYFQFITNGPYPTHLLKAADNPRAYLSLLKNAGYATDSNYVESNMRVVDQYNLTQYDKMEEAKEWTVSKVINVHAGHNFKCPGANGKFSETTEDRKVKNAVIKYLRQEGCTVYDCTDEDANTVNGNLYSIVTKCNAHEVDYDISIHFNAFNGVAHGTESYVWSLDRAKNAAGIDCANRIHKRLVGLGFSSRGVKDGHKLYVVRNTYAPAVLVEVCFCDNITDANLYKKLGPDRIGRAIASGILGKDIPAESKAETPKQKTIKAKRDAVVFEPTGSLKAGAITDYVDETSEFYILHGNRFVKKEDVDAL